VIQNLRRALTRQNRTARAREPVADWRLTLKRRIRVAAVCLGLWALAIETRLVYLQIIARTDLAERAERQQKHTVKAPGKRGDILDRRGRILATSADADTIYAVPSEIGDAASTVAKLCQTLGDCSDRERQVLLERFNKRNSFAYVRRQISPEEAQAVAALGLEGIGFVKETKRFYPNKELAAHLVGYVGVDNTGLNGVEFAYDRQIRGKDGSVLVNTDAKHHAFNSVERPPTSGSSIELTLDEYLQHITERELHAGVVENRAAGGSAVVLDPKTGEILAMANEPTFNPNAFQESAEADRRNRAVQDLYEPGSTFKLVTASAAIEEHVMPIDSLIDTSPGYIEIAGRFVHDTTNHGVLSFGDVIADSSNVGAIKIGLRVGSERLSEYVRRYGFGRPVSRDFPGESPGIVWDPAKWNEGVLAHVAIGYQVGVTPLQMVAAVASIANGGEYIEPRIVRAAYRDNRRYVVPPKIVRRTVSADTAATLTTIMEGVVELEHGTGKPARMPGYTVAGKTGTAAKLVNNRYSNSEYNASFVGFLPSRQPALAIIVVLDSPHGPNHYFGGPVSAPVFKRIAESAMRYLGIAPTINPMPPVLVARHGIGSPQPTSAVETQAPVVSFVADGPAGTVPDLRGLSARDAMRALVKLGLTAHLTGDGFVVSQDPAAGTLVGSGGICRLRLDRAVIRTVSEKGQP
jgi:cell division protein FtsI (penicillin-binding protein 3)